MASSSRRVALWRTDLDGGICPAPEGVGEARPESVTVTLGDRIFESPVIEDVEWQLTGIEWPDDFHPGIIVTAVWHAPDAVHVRPFPLEEPVTVDGISYLYEYDPKVTTRDYTADASNRAKVLYGVRKHGRIFDDGSAVLAEDEILKRSGLGRGTKGQFLLKNALDQLIREGFLTRVVGSQGPAYPPVDGDKPLDLLFYAPLVEPIPRPQDDRQDHWVSGFARKLPRGSQPSSRQLAAHERAVELDGADPEPLAPGYTWVKRHHRNG